MKHLLSGIGRLLGLIGAAILGFIATGAAVIGVLVTFCLGLVAAVGLVGAMLSLAGWLFMGSQPALAAAGTMALIGGSAFVLLVVLFDRIGAAVAFLRKPKDAPFVALG
jgi:hypothetical protein